MDHPMLPGGPGDFNYAAFSGAFGNQPGNQDLFQPPELQPGNYPPALGVLALQQQQQQLLPADLLNFTTDLPPPHSLHAALQQQNNHHYLQQQRQQEPQVSLQRQQQQHVGAQHDVQPVQEQPTSSQRTAPPDRDAKQALARQKNREAQQRFRERQRAKLAEASVEYDKVAEEVERLRLENVTLAKQNSIMEKVLTVRDAMMRAFDEFKGVTVQQQLGQAEAERAQGLMKAIHDLPTVEDMDQFTSSSEASKGRQQRQWQGEEGDGPSPGSSPEAAAGRSLQPAKLAGGGSGAQQGQEQQQQAEQGQQAQEGVAALSPFKQAATTVAGPAGCIESSDAAAAAGGSGASSSGGVPERPPSPNGVVPGGPAGPIWAGMRSGSAAGVEIDGSVLARAESIPRPTNQAVVQRLQCMASAQDFVQYWAQWKAEAARVCDLANANGWGYQELKEADVLMDDIITMWWHAAQLKPSYMIHLIETATRKNQAVEEEVSRSIADHIGPQLDAGSRRILRRSWQQYMRRLARAAIGVSRWVQRLQQIAAPTELKSMRSLAAGAVELAPPAARDTNVSAGAALCLCVQIFDITQHMRMAVEEEYLASMEFLANITPAVTHKQKLEINYMALPYLPDWVGVMYHILRQDGPGDGSGSHDSVSRALPVTAGAFLPGPQWSQQGQQQPQGVRQQAEQHRPLLPAPAGVQVQPSQE
ncbi:hypothetical protein N2152v2_007430 [Parachlorella kessleri]